MDIFLLGCSYTEIRQLFQLYASESKFSVFQTSKGQAFFKFLELFVKETVAPPDSIINMGSQHTMQDSILSSSGLKNENTWF
jgi:hypothetical protein